MALHLADSVHRIIDKTLCLAFPSMCAVCQHPPLESIPFLCQTCFDKLIWHTPTQNSLAKDVLPKGATQLCALFHYTGCARKLIHRYKYDAQMALAKPLGQWLAQSIATLWTPATIDAIIPVPLHSIKYRERGWNQSEHLASVVAKQLDLPLMKLLKKTHATPAQTHLNRHERLQNLSGHFEVVDCSEIPRTVVLVDDVFTTGATLQTCIQTLKETGVEHILLATLAVRT